MDLVYDGHHIKIKNIFLILNFRNLSIVLFFIRHVNRMDKEVCILCRVLETFASQHMMNI